MQHFVLSPTSCDSVEFDGYPLFGVAGDDVDGLTGGRWHDIDTYRTADGTLAVAVSYRTTAVGESAHCLVDTAQDVADVDAVLSLYEPKEFVVMEDGPARKRVIETLVRRYDLQVNDVLGRLEAETEASRVEARPL